MTWAYIAAYGKHALIRVCDQPPLMLNDALLHQGFVLMYIVAEGGVHAPGSQPPAQSPPPPPSQKQGFLYYYPSLLKILN